jgi:hypothetical protein
MMVVMIALALSGPGPADVGHGAQASESRVRAAGAAAAALRYRMGRRRPVLLPETPPESNRGFDIAAAGIRMADTLADSD